MSFETIIDNQTKQEKGGNKIRMKQKKKTLKDRNNE